MDLIYSILPRPAETVGNGLKKEGVNKIARKAKTRRSADGKEEFADVWDEQGEEQEESQVYGRSGQQRFSDQSEQSTNSNTNLRKPKGSEQANLEQSNSEHNALKSAPKIERVGAEKVAEVIKQNDQLLEKKLMNQNNLDLEVVLSNKQRAQNIDNNQQSRQGHLSTEYGPSNKSCATGLTPKGAEHIDEEV